MDNNDKSKKSERIKVKLDGIVTIPEFVMEELNVRETGKIYISEVGLNNFLFDPRKVDEKQYPKWAIIDVDKNGKTYLDLRLRKFFIIGNETEMIFHYVEDKIVFESVSYYDVKNIAYLFDTPQEILDLSDNEKLELAQKEVDKIRYSDNVKPSKKDKGKDSRKKDDDQWQR